MPADAQRVGQGRQGDELRRVTSAVALRVQDVLGRLGWVGPGGVDGREATGPVQLADEAGAADVGKGQVVD